MALPFKDSSFNIVISVASIKHWLDGRKGLEEIYRVLTQNGSAFIADADRDSTEEEIYKFASKFTACFVWDRFMRWYLRRVVFGESYARKEVEYMAKVSGFGQVEVEKVLGGPLSLERWPSG